MSFDAAGVRTASAAFGALAQRARENGQAVLRAAHEACRLPEDRVGHGFATGAAAFLGSPEGKAALGKALEAAWDLLRGVFGGAPRSVAGGPPARDVSSAQPPAEAAGGAERSGPLA